MVIALVLAAIAASFLTLSTSAVKVGEANFAHHGLVSVAERGLDQVLRDVNNYNNVFTDTVGVWSTTARRGRGAGQSAMEWWTTTAGWKLAAVPGYETYSTLGASGQVLTKTFRDNATGSDQFDVGDKRNATLTVILTTLPYQGIGEKYLPKAEAVVTMLPGATSNTSYTRRFAVWLSRSAGASRGLIAVKSVTLKGGSNSIDSYSSKKGAYDPTFNGTDYVNRSDRVYVASPSIAPDPFSGGNCNIFGFAATASDQIDSNNYGTGAHIYGKKGSVDEDGVHDTTEYDPKLGDHPYAETGGAFTGAGVDPMRLKKDYPSMAELGDAAKPVEMTTVLSAASIAALPDIATAVAAGGPIPAGDYQMKASWDIGKVADSRIIANNAKVRIFVVGSGGDVTGNAAASSYPSITMSGNGGLTVPADSSLMIYTPGNAKLGGNGLVNVDPDKPGPPSNFQLFGTNTLHTGSYATNDYVPTGGQSITINGNGAFSGVVTAPNSDLSIGGGGARGTFNGSAFIYTSTLNGGVQFHYDTDSPALSRPTYRIGYWAEPSRNF